MDGRKYMVTYEAVTLICIILFGCLTIFIPSTIEMSILYFIFILQIFCQLIGLTSPLKVIRLTETFCQLIEPSSPLKVIRLTETFCQLIGLSSPLKVIRLTETFFN